MSWTSLMKFTKVKMRTQFINFKCHKFTSHCSSFLRFTCGDIETWPNQCALVLIGINIASISSLLGECRLCPFIWHVRMWTKTCLSDFVSFAVAGPRLWNMLPALLLIHTLSICWMYICMSEAVALTSCCMNVTETLSNLTGWDVTMSATYR